MNRIAHIGLSVLTALILAVVIVRPQIVDSAVLLERQHPGYADWIMRAQSTYQDEGTDEPYLLTNVTKDGFGSVKPEDIELYLRYSKIMYPELSRASLCFTDGTGVEIIEDTARYGEIDETGAVVDGSVIDLDMPLIQQIDGLTMLNREYDERGNVIYQFRTDGNGNGVGDQYGVAGYVREYDRTGNAFERRNDNLISEQYLGTDGTPVNGRYGYAEVKRELDSEGHVIREEYYDEQRNRTTNSTGYAALERVYRDNKLMEEAYLDINDEPAPIGTNGYVRYENEYRDDGKLSLTSFYDSDGELLPCGSRYFHEYLMNLDRQDKIIFIAIKDEGTKSLTDTLLENLKELGLQTELKGKYRCSYYAILSPDDTKEDLSADSEVAYEGEIDGITFSIDSAGYLVGNRSSILIDGIEYSKKVRGLNFVIYDLKEKLVAESVAFDTCAFEMSVTR